MGTFKLLTLLGLLALPAFAVAEELGPDGFPAGWVPDDFAVGETIGPKEISVTVQPVKTPQTLRVEDMRRVSLTPSGSVPVALPVAGRVSGSADVSGSYYRPLATGLAVGGMGGISASGWQNNDLQILAGFGVLAPGENGIADHVWINSKLDLREKSAGVAFLRSLGGPKGQAGPVYVAPALKEAWRRLLLTRALPPGEASGTRPRAAGAGNWLAVRAELLERIGLHEAAWSLWREVGKEARGLDDRLAQGWTRASLLAGEHAQACALAREKAGNRRLDWWPLAVAVCAAVEAQTGGNPHALGLSLQLVGQPDAARNSAAMGLLAAVRDGRRGGGEGDAAWGALEGAVAAAYPALLGDDDYAKAPDVALRRLRESAALPDAVRTKAARALAEKTGWLEDGVALVRLVSGGVIGDATPDAAMVAWGRHAAQTRTPVSAGDVQRLVGAALRTGDMDGALAWGTRLSEAPSADMAQRRGGIVAAMMVEALAGRGVSETVMLRWLVAQDVGHAAGAAQAQRVLLGLEGLGIAVPEAVWTNYRQRAVKVNEGADAAWVRQLDGAVKAGDVPLVLSLITEGFGGRRAHEVAPGIVGESVAAMRGIGFMDIARRLVAEAALPPARGAGAGEVSPILAGVVSASVVPEVSVSAVGAVSATSPTAARREPAGMLPPPRILAPKRPATPRVTPTGVPGAVR